MKKRRHHYVWRNYLKPWTKNQNIYCYREGKIFNPNTMGIGLKRDFYKLRELTQKDISIIKKYFINPTDDHLQKINNRWLHHFTWTFNVKNKLKEYNIKNKDIDQYIDNAIHNFEEDLHSMLENRSIEYLDSIINEDVSFFDTKQGCIRFSYFLSVQLMRTEKVKSTFARNSDAVKKINPDFEFEKIWNIVSHILSTNLSWTIYASNAGDNPFKIILLKNKTPRELITADQPVVNTYNKFESKPPDNIEFYYPVSPNIAILVTQKKKYLNIKELNLNVDDVKHYNKIMIYNSHNQIYASSQGVLEENIIHI